MILIPRCRWLGNTKMNLTGVRPVDVHWGWVTITETGDGCCVYGDWTAGSWNRGIYWLAEKLREFRSAPRSRWELRSCGSLCSGRWQFNRDVSGQPIGSLHQKSMIPAFKGGTDRLSRHVANKLPLLAPYWPRRTQFLPEKLLASQVGLCFIELVWLAGWSVGWLVGFVSGWLVRWLVG